MCDHRPLLFLMNEDFFLSCLKVNQWASSPVRLAQALSFILVIIDSFELNQRFDLSLTMSFMKGACSSIFGN